MFKSFNYLNNLFNITSKTITKPSVAQTNSILLKADTGASRHYFRQQDAIILNNIKKVANGVKVHLLNNDILESNMTGTLPIPGLSTTAKEVQVLPSLTNTSLLSVGQLCNDNCTAIFTPTEMIIINKGQIITKDHLESLRPCPDNAIRPWNESVVLGKEAKVDIEAGEALNEDLFK